MKISDKFKRIKIKTVLELFVPLFALEHNWNVDDRYEDLFASKKRLLIKSLINEKEHNGLAGNIVRHPNPFYVCTDPYDDTDDMFVLDEENTWFEPKETFKFLLDLLHKNGAEIISTFTKSDMDKNCDTINRPNIDVIDDAISESVETMSLPILRKKVKELSAEKVKWDRSIAASTKVGLLFYEKNLPKPATEKEFKAEFKKHFQDLPGTTITRIYKNLPISPIQYKKTGDAPIKNTDIDPIIKAAVFAGFMEGTDGDVTGHELVTSLRNESYEVPDETVLQKIQEAMHKLK